MMIPLAFCFFLILVIALERAFVLRQAYLFPVHEIQQLYQTLESNREALPEIVGLHRHPMARILSYGFTFMPTSASSFKEALQDQARRERHFLERGLVILEIIVGVAPLFGLLGTALGMIDVFSHVSLEAVGRAEALSRGISEALLTTVFGLSIGIPALIAFNLLSRKVDALTLRIEEEISLCFHHLFPTEPTLQKA